MTRKQTERAFLAGIIEGEGTIYVRKQKTGGHEYRYPTVRVAMTDPDVLETCLSMAGLGRINGPYENTKYKDGIQTKPIYQWSVHGTDALLLIKAVLPYLHARRLRQVADVLEKAKGRID